MEEDERERGKEVGEGMGPKAGWKGGRNGKESERKRIGLEGKERGKGRME